MKNDRTTVLPDNDGYRYEIFNMKNTETGNWKLAVSAGAWCGCGSKGNLQEALRVINRLVHCSLDLELYVYTL